MPYFPKSVADTFPPELKAILQAVDDLPEGPTLELLQSQHDLERQRACEELELMAVQFAAEEENRKKLWGKKYPRVLGAIPQEINPVKQGKGKTRRTGKKRGKGGG